MELVVNRSENKYYLNYVDACNLRSKLDLIMDKDEYSKDNGYLIRNLYFDSINNIDFREKLDGTQIRKKIRLRVYDLKSKKCKLEVKQKNGEYEHKISLWITVEDAKELIKCNYSILMKYFDESNDAIYIYKTMQLGCYRPVALIEYRRIAYKFDSFDTRLTFDYKVRASESNFNIFNKNINFNDVIGDKVIFEVKYNRVLLDIIKDVLKKYKLNKVAISKYSMSRPIYYNFEY